jgi:hypothetical protein
MTELPGFIYFLPAGKIQAQPLRSKCTSQPGKMRKGVFPLCRKHFEIHSMLFELSLKAEYYALLIAENEKEIG